MSAILYPSIDPVVEALIRRAYGVLLFATLISTLPHARRYFLSERWGGYGQRSLLVDAVQNPVGLVIVLGSWLGAAIALAVGWHVVAASVVNVAWCWYFFVQMRWRSVLRGMGAPGFITFWLGGVVFFLAFTSRFAPAAHDAALWAAQVDFALIMISAGLYKLAAGYRSGDGMDLGMVNPEWGYWASRWERWPPSHPLFRLLNEMAWVTEVSSGVLMLIPATRVVGGLLILASFLVIATEIRLGFLCEMVVVCCLLFVPASAASRGASAAGSLWQSALVAGLWAYVLLLPVVRSGLFYNQLKHKPLPHLLQRVLDGYANLFGLMIWRVFSADIVNFFVLVWEQPAKGAPRRLISEYEGFSGFNRFRQVAECIAITSVFTTLKYYPSNHQLFTERLTRYARTVPHAAESTLVFQWVGIKKGGCRFERVPAAEYAVELDRQTITETVLSDRVSTRSPAASSPVHEGVAPGSYAPLRR